MDFLLFTLEKKKTAKGIFAGTPGTPSHPGVRWLGLLGLHNFSPDCSGCKNGLSSPTIAVIGFESQWLQSEQSESTAFGPSNSLNVVEATLKFRRAANESNKRRQAEKWPKRNKKVTEKWHKVTEKLPLMRKGTGIELLMLTSFHCVAKGGKQQKYRAIS